jgi:hypothetical protein
MARVREQQGCCARAHRDMLTASLGTLVQWPRSPLYIAIFYPCIPNAQWGKNGIELKPKFNND